MPQHIAAGPAVARNDDPSAAEISAESRGKRSCRLRRQTFAHDPANAGDGDDQIGWNGLVHAGSVEREFGNVVNEGRRLIPREDRSESFDGRFQTYCWSS